MRGSLDTTRHGPPPGTRFDARATVALAGVLFIGVFAFRVIDSEVSGGEGYLLTLPVAVLALRFGLRGGLSGAATALALIAAWALLKHGAALTFLSYFNRAVALITLGSLLGLFVDRHAQLEVQISQHFDVSLDLLATSDATGYLTRVNPSWTRLLGHSADELCSRPAIEFVHPDDRDATRRQAAALIAGGAAATGFRNRYRTVEGDYRWLEWSASFSSSERLIHAVARDVSAQHDAEQQLEDTKKLLEGMVTERTRELEDARRELLRRLAVAAEFHDDETAQHTQRVGILAAEIATSLGLDGDKVALLRDAAPLHDVGKLAIPDRILGKRGGLTADEFAVMKTHTVLGARLLSGSASPVLHMAATVAQTHHERWDGSGYPDGLAGSDIPLMGRVVAVADVFDALTHDRPYKRAWSFRQARAELLRGAGHQFDPRVVQAFLRVCDKPVRRAGARSRGRARDASFARLADVLPDDLKVTSGRRAPVLS